METMRAGASPGGAPTGNRTLLWTSVLLALGEYIDGYDLLVMGAALLFLKPEFGLSSTLTGFLSSSAFLGAVIGMFVFGSIADRLGRRVIFVFNLIVFVGFSVLSAFVTNVPELFIARFFVGLAVGMDIPANTAFLAEIAPPEKRGGYLGTLPNLLWVGGAVTATILGLALLGTGPDAWRWMFGVAAIPALFIPDSACQYLVNIHLNRQNIPQRSWTVARRMISV